LYGSKKRKLIQIAPVIFLLWKSTFNLTTHVLGLTRLIASFCGRLKPDQKLIPIHNAHLHPRHLVRPVGWLPVRLALLH